MLRNTAYLFGSRVVSAALAFVMGAVVLRVLGPAGQGDYAQLTSWIAVFVTVFGFSAAPAIFHFSNETAYSYTRGQLAGSALALWALAMLLSAAGVYVAPLVWPGIFSVSFSANLGLILLTVAAQLGAGLLVLSCVSVMRSGFCLSACSRPSSSWLWPFAFWHCLAA